jgi:hypothetical protein
MNIIYTVNFHKQRNFAQLLFARSKKHSPNQFINFTVALIVLLLSSGCGLVKVILPSLDAPTITTTNEPTAHSSGNALTINAKTLQNISILNEGADSLTILVTKPTNMTDITLITIRGKYILTEDFSALILMNNRSEANTCFRYSRNESTQPLPLDCDPTRLFVRQLSPVNVYWYDSVTNRSLDIQLMRGKEVLGICSAANPRCDF